jgi:superkiller protein 3
MHLPNWKPWRRPNTILVQQPYGSGEGSPNKRLAEFSERLSLLGWITFKLLVPALLAGLIGYFFYLVYTPSYRLAPFKSPKELAKMGYTGDVLRDAFALRVSEIEAVSNSTVRRVRDLQTTESKIDFQIPRTSFSFQSLVQYLRDKIGPGDIVVYGDVVKLDTGYEMFALVSDPRPSRPYTELKAKGDTLDAVIEATALKVISQLDPLVAGTFKMNSDEARCGTACKPSDFTDAMADLNQALLSPSTAIRYRALIGMVNILALSGQHKIAASYAQNASDLDNSQVDAYEMLGVEQMALGELDQASATFKQAIQRDPKASFPYLDLGNVLQAQHRLGDAIVQFRRAITNWPGNLEAKARLAYTLSEATQYSEATDTFTELLAFEPESAPVHNDYANNLREAVKATLRKKTTPPITECKTSQAKGGFGDAIAEHREALKLETANEGLMSRFHLDLGKTLKECGDIKLAEQEFVTATTHDPTNVGAYEELGTLREEQGRTPQALSDFARVIDLAGYNREKCARFIRAYSSTDVQAPGFDSNATEKAAKCKELFR